MKSYYLHRDFILLCLSSFTFSASFNMIIPELPEFLRTLGGEKYIGLIISLFTLTAGLSRPFSGKLTDGIWRKPIMIFGAMVCVICSLFYPLVSNVLAFFILRLLHGFSTGFFPTGATTFVSDIIPQKNWGEFLGIQGLFFSSGMALGPAIGGWIALHYAMDVLFYTSSCMALMSVILVYFTREHTISTSFRFSDLKLGKGDIFALAALHPAIITFLTYLSFGMILTLIPDWTAHLGFQNKGIFFVIFTLASLLIRVLAGKYSDIIGREKLLFIALILFTVSLLGLSLFRSQACFITFGILYGIAVGIFSPSINAWTIDLSNRQFKGRSIATMYIALEEGIGLGALLSGTFYKNDVQLIPGIMMTTAVASFIGALYMLAILTRAINPIQSTNKEK